MAALLMLLGVIGIGAYAGKELVHAKYNFPAGTPIAATTSTTARPPSSDPLSTELLRLNDLPLGTVQRPAVSSTLGVSCIGATRLPSLIERSALFALPQQDTELAEHIDASDNGADAILAAFRTQFDCGGYTGTPDNHDWESGELAIGDLGTATVAFEVVVDNEPNSLTTTVFDIVAMRVDRQTVAVIVVIREGQVPDINQVHHLADLALHRAKS